MQHRNNKRFQSGKHRYHTPSRRNSPNGVETSIVAAGTASVITDYMSEDEGVFDHGSSTFSSLESLNTGDINPATGLPMVDGIGSVDSAGNAFGTSHDDVISEMDHDTTALDSSDSLDGSSSFDSFDT